MRLTVENASFSYKKGTPVLQNINFSVGSGELMAILGPNGTGKTTLLRCLIGSLKWESGSAFLDGTDIRSIPSRRFWQRVAYVPQARGALTSLKVSDMILLGRTRRIGLFSTPKAEDIAKARSLSEELGISGLLDKKCSEISGGELQMVLIARALAAEPELMILDEPESNLDFRNQLTVLNALSSLTAKGMCCIFNTHSPSNALMRAGKSLLIRKGGESLFGNTAAVLSEENIRQAFGVRSAFGEVETDGKMYRTILPLEIVSSDEARENGENENRIAVISAIFSDYEVSEKINTIFHSVSPYIIGRMGLPYHSAGLYIINVTLDAPLKIIRSITQDLSILSGVDVKTTFAVNSRKE